MIVAFAAECVVAGCNKIDDPEQKDDPHDDHNYLTFEAVEAGATVKLEIIGKLEAPSLEYSTDKLDWTSYDFGKPQTITLKNVGDKVYWRNISKTDHFSKDVNDYIHFVFGIRKVAGEGNIMSLIDNSCESVTIPSKNCFNLLFNQCESLTKAPKLPALNLTAECYRSMFNSCSSLVEAPELPATDLEDLCYKLMFRNCTSLEKGPALRVVPLYAIGAGGCPGQASGSEPEIMEEIFKDFGLKNVCHLAEI